MDIISMAVSKALAKEYTDSRLVDVSNFKYYYCSDGEYNSSTGVPTISSPAADTFYITPAVSGNNVFNVYVYKNNAWVLFKSASVDLSELFGEITELKGDLNGFKNIENKSEIIDTTGSYVTIVRDTTTYGESSTVEYSTREGETVDANYTRNDGSKVYPMTGQGTVPETNAPIGRILNCIASYVKETGLVYGKTNTLFSATCDQQISDASFITAVLYDIPYENSRYASGNSANALGNNIGDVLLLKDNTIGWKHLIPNQMAAWFAKKLRLFEVPANVEKAVNMLQPGDILFDSTNTGALSKCYYGIRSVVMVLGTLPDGHVIVARTHDPDNDNSIFTDNEANACRTSWFILTDALLQTRFRVFARPNYGSEEIIEGDNTHITGASFQLNSVVNVNTHRFVYGKNFATTLKYFPVKPGWCVRYTGKLVDDGDVAYTCQVLQFDADRQFIRWDHFRLSPVTIGDTTAYIKINFGHLDSVNVKTTIVKLLNDFSAIIETGDSSSIGDATIINSNNELADTISDYVFVLRDYTSYNDSYSCWYGVREGESEAGITRTNGTYVFPLASQNVVPAPNAPKKRVMETIKSYVGKSNLVYGNYNTMYNDEVTNEIDCSCFCSAVIIGTDYNKSRYVLGSASQNKFDENPGDTLLYYTEVAGWRRLLASQMAQWFARHGRLFELPQNPQRASAMLQFGDILFSHATADTDNVKYYKISHCQMVIATFPQEGRVLIAQGGDTSAPVISNEDTVCKTTLITLTAQNINDNYKVFARPNYGRDNEETVKGFFLNDSGDEYVLDCELQLNSFVGTDGVLTSATTWAATPDYYKVIPGYTIHYTGLQRDTINDVDYSVLVYEYDKDKHFIKYTGVRTADVVLTANTKYVRFNFGHGISTGKPMQLSRFEDFSVVMKATQS